MLASRGLSIYDSRKGDIAITSPVKSLHFDASATSSFQWEGTTYLILPTVLDSLSTGGISNSSIQTNNHNLTQRSISDSGASIKPTGSFIVEDADTDNGCKTDTAPLSRGRKLSFKHRSISVDALCTDTNSNTQWDRVHTDPYISQDNKRNVGGSYVEWRTCSVWLRQASTNADDCKDSRGYVDWDTIWTTPPSWLNKAAHNEHVYDDVCDNNIPYFCDTTSVCSLPVGKCNSGVTADTPPALPERTYINRLKNNNNNNNDNETTAAMSSSPQKKKSSHRSHAHHHDNSYSRKSHHHHHYHHHHHHNHNKQHREHRLGVSSIVSSANKPISSSSSLSSRQHTHEYDTEHQHHQRSAFHNDVINMPQTYAVVHKLKGYKFDNPVTTLNPPAPHKPCKSAIYSENYCHLAPVTSKECFSSWQTGDILDYIDGLHDSMSPKRRENIYTLINNKQTRAKFSESLEIESRLLSKGLISSSGVSDRLNARKPASSGNSGSAVKFGIIQKKRATVPVTSTYV